jgi:phage terminase large subunit-like protein
VAGALWSYELLERCRTDSLPDNRVMCAIGVDPSISDPEKQKNPSKQPDECGIIAGYLLDDARAVVINDLSAVLSPNDWAKVAVGSFGYYKANKIAAEDNQGGEMVRLTIQSVGPAVPVELVHASLGKRARAEPVVALYEQGRVLHYWPKKSPNPLAKLEHEQCTWDASNPSAKSPNRVDALVILMHALGLCNATGTRRYSRLEQTNEEDEDET